MEQRHNASPKTGPEEGFIEIFKSFGNRVGVGFYRAIFYDDGRIEVEYHARNPVECLVLKLGSQEEALDLLKDDKNRMKKCDCAVIRKKCTKCFLHERETTLAEVR